MISNVKMTNLTKTLNCGRLRQCDVWWSCLAVRTCEHKIYFWSRLLRDVFVPFLRRLLAPWRSFRGFVRSLLHVDTATAVVLFTVVCQQPAPVLRRQTQKKSCHYHKLSCFLLFLAPIDAVQSFNALYPVLPYFHYLSSARTTKKQSNVHTPQRTLHVVQK